MANTTRFTEPNRVANSGEVYLVPLHSDFDRLNKMGPKQPMPVPQPPPDRVNSTQGSISKSQNHCAEVPSEAGLIGLAVWSFKPASRQR